MNKKGWFGAVAGVVVAGIAAAMFVKNRRNRAAFSEIE